MEPDFTVSHILSNVIMAKEIIVVNYEGINIVGSYASFYDSKKEDYGGYGVGKWIVKPKDVKS